MTMDVRKVARPTLAVVAFSVVAGVGWLVTTDTGSVTVPFPAEAGVDAPVDAFVVDSAIDAPDAALETEWTLQTIASAQSTGLRGADGTDVLDIAGQRVVISGWEGSGTITVSTRTSTTSGTWSTVNLATVGNVEDAKFCDVDQDGATDIIAGGQGKRIRVWFGPAPWSTSIDIDAATNMQFWMQLACTVEAGGVVKIWAGGRNTPTNVSVGYFTNAGSPRTASNYTWHPVHLIAWLMSLIPFDMDGDGDLDLIITDRQNIANSTTIGNKGSVWFERTDPSGVETWTRHIIRSSNNEGDPKFGELFWDVTSRVVTYGISSGSHPNKLVYSRSTDNGASWASSTVSNYPTNVGQYQGVATLVVGTGSTACDLTGDGVAEYVLTHSGGTGSQSGLVALNPVTGERIDIDRGAGKKYDDPDCIDMDGDGDLDILTSEQHADVDLNGDGDTADSGETQVGLGVIWFKNYLVQ